MYSSNKGGRGQERQEKSDPKVEHIHFMYVLDAQSRYVYAHHIHSTSSLCHFFIPVFKWETHTPIFNSSLYTRKLI